MACGGIKLFSNRCSWKNYNRLISSKGTQKQGDDVKLNIRLSLLYKNRNYRSDWLPQNKPLRNFTCRYQPRIIQGIIQAHEIHSKCDPLYLSHIFTIYDFVSVEVTFFIVYFCNRLG